MREWCGCGASIRAQRSDVLAWRKDYHHGGQGASAGYPPTSGGSHVENASAPQTGFIPEPPE